jgi:hypothetical protein
MTVNKLTTSGQVINSIYNGYLGLAPYTGYLGKKYNFMYQLKEQGLIDHIVFSIYVDH